MYGAASSPCFYCGHMGSLRSDEQTKRFGHLLQIDGFRPCQFKGCECRDFCMSDEAARNWRLITNLLDAGGEELFDEYMLAKRELASSEDNPDA